MEYLFAYGTLKDKNIQETIFGRLLKGTPDSLHGYAIQKISIEEEFGMEEYPIIVPSDDASTVIEGILYEISAFDLEKVDTYEGRHYKRIEVTLQSNTKAWAYVITT
ncbi:gamma-glutamylcyclotransferase family protein [Flavobacterium agrisoli]|uniref:Putative gamma-glutamylcyclotransferase n=1 Tax=Flavobacterium agrisoli TaxID=2793066 RepID=A0A934PM76_9FLAO|nr:gamma-glutamylcyclotransferase family protein [Flavobacterium agrisoli]MBK0369864.1 gamma-glutamylcyclotransferase [Flavobacterium agrisoli]